MNPAQVIERFAECLSTGDTAAALALYEPGAAFVVEPGTVASGHEAIGEALHQFASLRPVFTGHIEQIVQADDVALVVNCWTLAGTTPAGDAVHMAGRSADVLRRGADGNWRITIDDPWGGAE